MLSRRRPPAPPGRSNKAPPDAPPREIPPAERSENVESVPPDLQRPNTTESIARETKLVRRADDALRDGLPEIARSILRDYRREFPRGTLALEARALEHIAACEMRRPKAKIAAQTYVASNPDSGLTRRVRRSCRLGEEKER